MLFTIAVDVIVASKFEKQNLAMWLLDLTYRDMSPLLADKCSCLESNFLGPSLTLRA